MKINSSLFRTTGALLALLAFTLLPNSVQGDLCNPAHDPACELYYGSEKTLALELVTDCPVAATIFYTKTLNTPNYSTPCHDANGNPCTGTYAVPNGTLVYIPYGSTMYINMLAWKPGMLDSNVVSCEQHNPNE